MKSLEYYKDFNHAVAISDEYALIAYIYYSEGDYDRSMQYCKQHLTEKIPFYTILSKVEIYQN